jgi:hypothetical protein
MANVVFANRLRLIVDEIAVAGRIKKTAVNLIAPNISQKRMLGAVMEAFVIITMGWIALTLPIGLLVGRLIGKIGDEQSPPPLRSRGPGGRAITEGPRCIRDAGERPSIAMVSRPRNQSYRLLVISGSSTAGRETVREVKRFS